jgi:hypothetical protein
MRLRIAASIALLGIAILASAPVSAAEKAHPAAKIKLWFPDGWELAEDEGDWTIQDPDEEVTIALTLFEASQFDAALDDLDRELAKKVDNLVRASKPTQTKINGLKATGLTARGKHDGIPVEIEVLLVATPADKILLFYGMAEAGKFKKHSRTITRILQSIKKS